MANYRVAEITESAVELDARLEHKEYYAEKIAGLKPESRRLREILAVRCLLKEMMGEEQWVTYDEDGRPSLGYPELTTQNPQLKTQNSQLTTQNPFISISHTDGFAAVIISDKPVGIDIERRGKKVEKVVTRFMQESEIALVEAERSNDRNLLCIHLIWSAKEATYKVLGKEYFDLQHLTCVKEIDFEKETITMAVTGRENPLSIHFKYTDAYVLCYFEL